MIIVRLEAIIANTRYTLKSPAEAAVEDSASLIIVAVSHNTDL